MSQTPPSILGVVLSGGKSSRMGTCKAQLPHASSGTYLQHALSEIAKVSDEVAVSLNPSQQDLIETLTADTRMLIDVRSDRGPAEGILQSLQYAITIGCAGVLVTPVDLPHLHGHEMQALAVAFEDAPDLIACGVSSDDSEHLEPLVAIYPAGFVNEIERLVASDDRSLYRFIQRNPHQTVRLSSRSLANVNTPEDFNP